MVFFRLMVIIFSIFLYSTQAYAQTIGYKGEILYFTGNPFEDKKATIHYKDGLLLVKNGYIVEAGEYAKLNQNYKPDQVIDYSGKIITPGFIDTHIHYPQLEIIGSYGEQLIDWLEKYTYPAEMKFNDVEHATNIADFFIDSLIKNGTTTAMVFSTTHPESVDAFFNSALKKNMRMITGKVLMDRNAPKDLLDTPEKAFSESEQLIKKWKNKGRLGYAVTPRFAPTSTDKELEIAGKLLRKYPDVWLQTHLAENKEEVAWVKSLFPKRKSYLDVYDHHGLVTKKSIFAHAVHLNGKDFSLLSRRKSAIAFCPTSNFFLGSGVFNLTEAKKHQIKVGLGTDVGAGTSLSLLKTMGDAYKAIQIQKNFSKDPESIDTLSPLQNFYLATLGGAIALSLDKYIGSFLPGKEADFIVLNPKADALAKMKIVEDQTKTIEQKLFTMLTLGGEEFVQHTYIMGVKEK